MNWVGGSRSRLVIKNDAKKQREFFEKRKMEHKLKNLGIALSETSRGTTSGSMDLVTLFIVNQIAAKKEDKDPPSVATLGSCKGGSKRKRNESLVLPMSPCSPSQLPLVGGQPQFSIQVTRKGKHNIPHRFKCRQLSPVLESAFSDKSASDYAALGTDPSSPLSSISSTSSGQVNLGKTSLVSSQLFPMQRRHQTRTQIPSFCSFPSLETSGLEKTKFQHFSQPRGMTDIVPCSYGSDPPFCLLETPTPAQALFGFPEPDISDARDHAEHGATFSFKKPEDTEPVVDFTLSPSETEQQFEKDTIRGFCTDKCETGGSRDGRGNTKIYLRDELLVEPQIVPQYMEVELCSCSDIICPCLEHNGPMSCGDCSSSACARDYQSSDSDDEEEYCQPCLDTPSSFTGQTCCSDVENPSLGSEGNPKQKFNNPRLSDPLRKPSLNSRDGQETAVQNMVCPEEALSSHPSENGTVNFESFQALGQTESSKWCKCIKTINATRDAGTQTDNKTTTEQCDASTQCSSFVHCATKAPTSTLHHPPSDVSLQQAATGRQTDAASVPRTPAPSSCNMRIERKHTPWNKTKSVASTPYDRNMIKTSFAKNSDGKLSLQRPTNPFVDALNTDGRGKEKREDSAKKGQEENGYLLTKPSHEVRDVVTSATRVNRLSEETETLEEIADILLLLKQR